MNKGYLTRREFMGASAGTAGILTLVAKLALVAKTAGTRVQEDSKGNLEAKSDVSKSAMPNNKITDPRYMELILQHRSTMALYGDIPNYGTPWR